MAQNVKEAVDPGVADPATRPEGSSEVLFSDEEAELRRDLLHALSDANFPADRNALIRHLGQADRRSDLVTRLRLLPEGPLFDSPEEVLRFMSGISSATRPSPGRT